jgi:hypothetical protein
MFILCAHSQVYNLTINIRAIKVLIASQILYYCIKIRSLISKLQNDLR